MNKTNYKENSHLRNEPFIRIFHILFRRLIILITSILCSEKRKCDLHAEGNKQHEMIAVIYLHVSLKIKRNYLVCVQGNLQMLLYMRWRKNVGILRWSAAVIMRQMNIFRFHCNVYCVPILG